MCVVDDRAFQENTDEWQHDNVDTTTIARARGGISARFESVLIAAKSPQAAAKM
jgi:hypothetical protein